jgi:hypothetical protein
MDDSKFARVTANLLVRKGDAAPSAVKEKSSNKPRSRSTTNAAALPLTHDNVVAMNGFHVPDGIFNRTASQHAPRKLHKIMVALSDEEHETLGLIAAKKGFTRHQIVRNALEGYFAWLADEYGRSCRCISSTCSAECDHLNAAEVAEQLEPDRQAD